MKKQLKRAVATAAVCAVGATGSLSYLPSAHADEAGAATTSASPERVATKFGHEAWAYGTKVLLGGVDVYSAKDAQAKQGCTDIANIANEVQSLASVTSYLPQELQDLVRISPLTSSTQTYKSGAIDGVRATSTIADIKIGGNTIGGTKLPALKIAGLKSVADSFHDGAAARGSAWKTNESFGFEGMSIDYEGTVVDGTPLADLLDILNQVSAPVSQIVNQVFDLLAEVGTIEIPGLLKLGLGQSSHKIGANSATSKAYALRLDLLPQEDIPGTVIELGQARSRISAPLTSAYFRSNVMGLDLKAGNDLLHLGSVQHKTIPCEGTNGKTYTKKIKGTSFPISIPGLDNALVSLKGIEYAYSGTQLDKGRAKALTTSSLGSLEIPALGLVIKGVTTTVKLTRSGPRERVQTQKSVSVADILVNGESLLKGLQPTFGDVFEFVDSVTGQTNIIDVGAPIEGANNSYGAGYEGIRLTLPGLATKLSIGWVAAHIRQLGKIKQS